MWGKRMIRSLLLDLDGTLINSERGFAKCFVDVLNNNFGCNATTTDYINYELRQNTQLINHFRSLGKSDGAAAILRPILQDKHIFGVNLDEAGLCEKVLLYFNEMNEGPGAVRRTLKKYLG
jgi:beta-phosphoglucomutase-like phosphatase (HAD superfamily)